MRRAGAALAVSDIPFAKNVAAVRVGRDEAGKYIINPTLPEYETGGMDIVVAGTLDGVMMVEGGGHEISEEDFLGAVEFAHTEIKKIVKAIDRAREKSGKEERFHVSAARRESEALDAWVEQERSKKTSPRRCASREKLERNAAFAKFSKENCARKKSARQRDRRQSARSKTRNNKDFEKIIKTMEEEELRVMVVDDKYPSPTAASPTRSAQIWSKVGILPRVHGTGVFHARSKRKCSPPRPSVRSADEQRLDGIMAIPNKRYMHYYNFPPYSVGRDAPDARDPAVAKSVTAISRNARSCRCLPPQDEFPYTLRLISEVLESKRLVVDGVGLRFDPRIHGRGRADSEARRRRRDGPRAPRQENTRSSPISKGFEDSLGEMDFKVAGTVDGITAIQMDIKVDGITIDIMREAMARRRSRACSSSANSRKRCPEARTEASLPYAPRMIVVQISPDKIKDVIGPGGKVINKIIAETGVKIDIEKRRPRLHRGARRRRRREGQRRWSKRSRRTSPSARPTWARSRA